MSRDPYDDYQYDDPDRAARERPPGDDRAADRDARQVALARRATALPGLLLILNGLFGLLVCGLFAVVVVNPEGAIRQGRAFMAKQPPGPDRQEAEQNLDELENQINQDRAGWQLEGAIELAVMVLANGLVVVGGFALRGLGSYSLSMAGAVASLVPCLTGCCCTGLLPGLWAVFVLMSADVKDGFAARGRASAAPDPY